jgi:hypothetical protein
MEKLQVNGILLLYHHFLAPNAPTIMEHINAIKSLSNFKVWCINTEMGMPSTLRKLDFKIIVLHYSIFGSHPYMLDKDFYNFLQSSQKSWKIAFFQDEYYRCEERFKFINEFNINCIYTLIEPPYFKDFYLKYTNTTRIYYTIPSYVSDDLVQIGKQLSKEEKEKSIDIGYRGRKLPWFYTGKGSQEKAEIAIKFAELAKPLRLKTDISTEENERIYGNAWYEFIASCRAVLGVEAGVSIMDIDGEVRRECEKLIQQNPDITFQEVYNSVLYQWENNIPYRTIGPRHFEAASLKTCQILFEGNYSSIMKPMVHYIPLKKDFSNFDEVIAIFTNQDMRSTLVNNAYNDMILSGKYTYKEFVTQFDNNIIESELMIKPDINIETINEVDNILNKGYVINKFNLRISTNQNQIDHNQVTPYQVTPFIQKFNFFKLINYAIYSPFRVYRNWRIKYYPAPIKQKIYSKMMGMVKLVRVFFNNKGKQH